MTHHHRSTPHHHTLTTCRRLVTAATLRQAEVATGGFVSSSAETISATTAPHVLGAVQQALARHAAASAVRRLVAVQTVVLVNAHAANQTWSRSHTWTWVGMNCLAAEAAYHSLAGVVQSERAAGATEHEVLAAVERSAAHAITVHPSLGGHPDAAAFAVQHIGGCNAGASAAELAALKTVATVEAFAAISYYCGGDEYVPTPAPDGHQFIAPIPAPTPAPTPGMKPCSHTFCRYEQKVWPSGVTPPADAQNEYAIRVYHHYAEQRGSKHHCELVSKDYFGSSVNGCMCLCYEAPDHHRRDHTAGDLTHIHVGFVRQGAPAQHQVQCQRC
jgi:hypothetical protein